MAESSPPAAPNEVPETTGWTFQPPDILNTARYTKNYCEENVFLLAQTLLELSSVQTSWEVFVVFISNPTKSVALWNQKARDEGVVVWDYHVILLLRPRIHGTRSAGESDRPGGLMENEDSSDSLQCWVYDFDTRLAMPCPCRDYLSRTFDLDGSLPDRYQSLFRVISAPVFVDEFASDRSHMVLIISTVPGMNEDDAPMKPVAQSYAAPPPLYLPLVGQKARERGVFNNLMEAFVNMSPRERGIGTVVTLNEFMAWCIFQEDLP